MKANPATYLQNKTTGTSMPVETFNGADDGVPAVLRTAQPFGIADASGASLKTVHWTVSLTRTHLIGSNPVTRLGKLSTKMKDSQVEAKTARALLVPEIGRVSKAKRTSRT